jgi:hypothetical protein
VIIIKPQVPHGTDVTRLNALCCDCCVTAKCSPLRSTTCCSALKFPNTCTGTQFFPPLLVNEYHLEGARGCAEALSALCSSTLPMASHMRAALDLSLAADSEGATVTAADSIPGPGPGDGSGLGPLAAAPGTVALVQQLLNRARDFCKQHSRPSVLYESV